MNLWSIKNSKQEAETIRNEMKILEGRSLNESIEKNSQISEKLLMRKLKKDDVKDIIGSFLSSLYFQKGNILNLEKMIQNEDHKGIELGSLLSLAEIFLSFSDKKTKEVYSFGFCIKKNRFF